MKKKVLLVILICGFMVFGITGCGNKSDSFTSEEKEQVVKEIESFIKSDRKTIDSNGYKNTYEVTITEIEKSDLNISFKGNLHIKYPDGTENNNVTFKGTSSLKPNPYSIYNTEVEYNY